MQVVYFILWIVLVVAFISSLWHGRPCDLATAAADNFWHGWQCSSMVSVLPVKPASVCMPRVCAINHCLPHLQCASGFCTGTSSVRLVHRVADLADWTPRSVAASLRRWYAGMQLNPDKTEVLWYATSRRQHQLPSTGMLIDGIHITPVKSVRDLGIYIDADLSMRMHVKKTVSCCFAALRQLR